MLLSRLRPKKKEDASKSAPKDKRKLPELEQYLHNRDYAGAISLLSFPTGHSSEDKKRDPSVDTLWLAYCAFHAGDYKMASDLYRKLSTEKSPPAQISLFMAICDFYLGNQDEAWKLAEGSPVTPLRTRLMFHVAHRKGDEAALMTMHRQLKEQLEDQLSLASIHYLRSHYQEAIDIYKAELLKNRNFVALNVYLALCYYKLDYYDVSLQVLQLYLDKYPDSATAVNLKACNHFKLYNGRSAENELRLFEEQATPTLQFARDVIKHNRVVFAGGEKALHILPSLLDIVPEARLNLIIYYLRQNTAQDMDSAFQLGEEITAVTPHEFIVKAIVYVMVGQPNQWKDHVTQAQQWFQSVGSSASECDTLPGRQCMAAAFFLTQQFDEVLVYLNSIKSYFYTDDTFNYNYGQALAQTGNYEEGELALLQVHDTQLVNSYPYMTTLCRCHIMNRRARLAWEVYLRLENNEDSFSLLQVIANDCYKTGAFVIAAKAFDALERQDSNPEYWEGKRGACCGAFQAIIAGKEPSDTLREVLSVLQTSDHPQVEYIARIMKKWANENKVFLG